jgi:hypothetical protein
MPYPHHIVEDIMSNNKRRQKIPQLLQSGEKKLYSLRWDDFSIYKNFTDWLQSREKKFTKRLLEIQSIRNRFIIIFLFALFFGLIYGFIAYYIDDYCQEFFGIHFHMSANFAGAFLVELIGYTVLIYGFFAAFLIYTISEIYKVSEEEYSEYKKVISKVLNIFAVVTAFVVNFIFFSILSMYELEKIKCEVVLENIKREVVTLPLADFPIITGAYLLFFMILICLLGYLVFSLVMGLLDVRGKKSIFATFGSEFRGFEDILFDSEGNMFVLGFGRRGQIIKISPTIIAGIEIKPETLDLNSKELFTAFITLPESYNIADIDISTVVCEGAPGVKGMVADDNKYIAKFDREYLRDDLPTGDAVTLTVTGKLYDGTVFEGSDTVRVIDK